MGFALLQLDIVPKMLYTRRANPKEYAPKVVPPDLREPEGTSCFRTDTSGAHIPLSLSKTAHQAGPAKWAFSLSTRGMAESGRREQSACGMVCE